MNNAFKEIFKGMVLGIGFTIGAQSVRMLWPGGEKT